MINLKNKINDAVIIERSFIYRRNVEKNKNLIRKFGGLHNILNMLNLKNVIVVGAGPSLDKYVDDLKKLINRQDVVIIATDMALRTLALNGIIPKFVITCETVPKNFFAGVDTSNIHLLSFSCSSHTNIRKWEGPISFYNWMKKGELYDELWQTAGQELGSVGTASIVTSQAVAIALGCEIRKLIILGNDLAFKDNYYSKYSERMYVLSSQCNRFSGIVSREKAVIRKAASYEIHRCEEKYYTSHQFLAAKQWFEELIPKKSISVYDGSIPGLSEKTLKRINPGELSSLLSLKRSKKKRRRK